MKNTIQISIAAQDQQTKDNLITRLSAIDYDGFEEKDNELLAYVQEQNYEQDALEAILSDQNLAYKKTVIEEQNWNALWESNFEPVMVDNFCTIRAEFHQSNLKAEHEIIITPKMSFGTGHHATTYIMISTMSKIDFTNKSVADFGTGTGVLAILAEKLGSKLIHAIDCDDWSIANAQENFQRNGCQKIELIKAESFQPTQKFDVVLANINRSVILSNVNGLLFGLNDKGILLLSGFLKEDEVDILRAFTIPGIKHLSTLSKNQWISLLLRCE